MGFRGGLPRVLLGVGCRTERGRRLRRRSGCLVGRVAARSHGPKLFGGGDDRRRPRAKRAGLGRKNRIRVQDLRVGPTGFQGHCASRRAHQKRPRPNAWWDDAVVMNPSSRSGPAAQGTAKARPPASRGSA
jgi:hypothetical protein